MIDMTFDGYIQNPMGVKNGVFTQREMYRGVYTDKLNKIMVREMGKFLYFLYKDGEQYIIHLKIPSEVVEKFYYDVVLEFTTKDEAAIASSTLTDYNVKFYSNDPAFVYTFAYSFLKNGIFVKDLVPRMSKTAVMNAAKERNPKNNVGYVKSLYFAYLVVKNYGLMKKIQFSSYGKPYDLKRLLNTVEHADSKVDKRKRAEVELNKTKAKAKSDTKPTASSSSAVNRAVKNITNTVKRTSMVKTINSKTTNAVKKVKFTKTK